MYFEIILLWNIFQKNTIVNNHRSIVIMINNYRGRTVHVDTQLPTSVNKLELHPLKDNIQLKQYILL